MDLGSDSPSPSGPIGWPPFPELSITACPAPLVKKDHLGGFCPGDPTPHRTKTHSVPSSGFMSGREQTGPAEGKMASQEHPLNRSFGPTLSHPSVICTSCHPKERKKKMSRITFLNCHLRSPSPLPFPAFPVVADSSALP